MQRQPHDYDHLDKDTKFSIEVPMRDLVDQVVRLNYGVHRFLSHLVDARRAHRQRRIEERTKLFGAAHALRDEEDGDLLADGIERLLLAGLC
jgi:hypothetical protein